MIFTLIALLLVGEDAIAGLDILAHQGQWDQCIAMAQKQVSYRPL